MNNNNRSLLIFFALNTFFVCRFIPESPRWLLSQNKNTKAVEITEAMAKENKMTLSKNIEVDTPFV